MIDLFQILSTEKKFRQDQVFRAWFDVNTNSYEEITTLPKDLREKLTDKPWLSVKLHTLQKSKIDDTQKALLKLEDGQLIEAVLMGRRSLKVNSDKPRYTICISSQVGCGMKCSFCATGKAGFSRNLTVEEIVDQYRFWSRYLNEKNGGEIDNMVVMGQGEPLLNYENCKTALNIILKYTNIGPSKITMSTCGIPAAMDRLVEDKDFPPVRFALSLHSAIETTRAAIMPSHQPGFLDYLVGWAKKYHRAFPSRAHFIGLEYIMLGGINDGPKDLKALITLASKLGKIKINLIPYNNISSESLLVPILEDRGSRSLREAIVGRPARSASPSEAGGGGLVGSDKENIAHWHETLMNAGFISTIRYSQGQDIAAACGQLRNLESKSPVS